MLDLFENREAVFSPCRRYRYRLRQIWEERAPCLNYICLNPSTADEIVNDPTVERCIRRGRSLGYGSVEITNIFSFRSTDPSIMLSQADPVGPDNDLHIIAAAKDAGRVVCAWGTHGKHLGRGEFVLGLLARHGIEPYCLKVNSDSSPAHPLYLPYCLDIIPYKAQR